MLLPLHPMDGSLLLGKIDTHNLPGSRRRRAEVRHVELSIMTKRHARWHDKTRRDILDTPVFLIRTTLPAPGVG